MKKKAKLIFVPSAEINVHITRFPRDTALSGGARTGGCVRLRRGEDEAGEADGGRRQENRKQVPRGLGQDQKGTGARTAL